MNLGALLATFLAAGVEWVEALTIVLAVGLTRGWRPALGGAAAALGGLAIAAAVIALVGRAAGAVVPLDAARAVIGLFLLLFGIRWLHKAVLRWAGLRPLHDEARAFDRARGEAETSGGRAAFAAAFGGTFLEGLEVVFIVAALAGLGGLVPAVTGAIAALVVVAAVGAVVRGPLSRVPENALKTVVGVMLTAFGTFFVGEGLGVHWWHDDWSLLLLVALYAIATAALTLLLRHPPAVRSGPAVRRLRAAAEEVWGLFVGEGPLALLTLCVVFGIGLVIARASGAVVWAGVALALGIVAALALALVPSLSEARERIERPGDGSDQEIQ